MKPHALLSGRRLLDRFVRTSYELESQHAICCSAKHPADTPAMANPV